MTDVSDTPNTEPVFPWNDAISLTCDDSNRAVVICLSAVFDAIQALRADLRSFMSTQPLEDR